MRGTLTAAAILLAAIPAWAGEIAFFVDKVDPGDVLPGYVTYDLRLNFTDTLRGQQLLVELTHGSIYQDPYGLNLPALPSAPPQIFIKVFPTLAYDTFVTMGGPTSNTSMGVLGVGCAANIPGGCDSPISAAGKFDSEGISYAWAPSTGVDPPPQNDFMIARLTFSNDARGTFSYFGSTADGGTLLKERLPIVAEVPEPTAAMLALAALTLGGLAPSSRVNVWRRRFFQHPCDS